MPEGPEIRRAADQVSRAIAGRRAEAVRFGLPALRRHQRTLTGRRIEAVESRGKALAEALGVSERTLYRKLRAYGLNGPGRGSRSSGDGPGP
jgi:endonuclease-8